METKKILVVDDDVDIITVMETILEKEGYSVIVAHNKEDGLLLARQEKPDMAILDVMMTTHYEGFELAQELVTSPEFSNMAVMMQSSIEVLVTTQPSVQEMAREYRKDPSFKNLQVLLIKNSVNGSAGIDYLSETGETKWFPVAGFLRKPIEAKKLIPEIKRVLHQ